MEDLVRLDAAALAIVVDEVAGLACGDPVELIDQLRQLERLKNAAAAAQARLAVELRQVREAEARAEGRNVKRVPASVAGEVGLARHESPHRAATLVGLATVLTSEMPHAMAAFSAGGVSEWHTTVLARERHAYQKPTVRWSMPNSARNWPSCPPGNSPPKPANSPTNSTRTAWSPASGKPRADRNVTIRPAPDCMTRVSALLPVVQGVAAYAALTAAADTAHAAGDERSTNQVMADTLIARVTGEEEAGEVHVEIQLVITDEALLGDSNTPARINNHGPIPAPIARGLAADAIGNNRAWVHRLYVRPDSGQLVAMESARRHFPKTMKAFIKTRDQVCRTPWCGAPIRHIDHLTPAHAGGTTTLANGQGLRERCNQLKQHPGWQHTA